MKKIIALSLFLIISISGVLSKEKTGKLEKYNHETKVIKAYLKELRNLSIDKIGNILVIVPCMRCKGCAQYVGISMNKNILKEHDNITFIWSNKDCLPIPKELHNKINIIEDVECLISSYNISLESVNIIKLKDGKVVDMLKYNAKNHKEFYDFKWGQ
ncbi:MAG: hypothetical protein ACEPOW_13145 [Bacteroidales bacterium]